MGNIKTESDLGNLVEGKWFLILEKKIIREDFFFEKFRIFVFIWWGKTDVLEIFPDGGIIWQAADLKPKVGNDWDDDNEDENEDEREKTKRKSRNQSEKKRRDQFNILINELMTLVAGTNRKMDKSTVLQATISFLKRNKEMSALQSFYELTQKNTTACFATILTWEICKSWFML